jgi:hypothetical protein
MRANHFAAAFLGAVILVFLTPLSGRAVNVQLAWNPSPDAATPGAVSGYKLYYSVHPLTNITPGLSIDALTSVMTLGNQTNVTVPNLTAGLTYYFAVTAIGTGGESDFSTPLNLALSNPVVPNPIQDQLPSALWQSTGGTVTNLSLRWDPSPDAATPGAVAAYVVYYSTHPLTNIVPGVPLDAFTVALSVGNQTNATVAGLLTGKTYYFGVAAKAADGTLSDLSNQLVVSIPSNALGGLPPLVDGMVPTVPSPTGGTGTGAGSSGSGSGTSTNQAASDTPTQLNLVGLLPRMWMSRTNGSPLVTLGGAVGASFTIQIATNVNGFEEWTTVTNIKMSVAAPNTPAPTGNALNKAFVPSLASWVDSSSPATNSGAMKFYRIFMPYGYAVVADQVLKPQGFNTRLIAVRLAALNAYIVCYVTEEGIYLDYNDETFIVKTQQSGPSIRQVATTVSTVLGQNWTSASEFTVTNDLKQILATVVQTDPPLSDPPLGTAGGVSIAIDF